MSIAVGGNERLGVELGQLFNMTDREAFSLTVACSDTTQCFFNVVGWDAGYTTPTLIPPSPLLVCQ